MAYDSLTAFVKALERAGELKRIKTTVSQTSRLLKSPIA